MIKYSELTRLVGYANSDFNKLITKFNYKVASRNLYNTSHVVFDDNNNISISKCDRLRRWLARDGIITGRDYSVVPGLITFGIREDVITNTAFSAALVRTLVSFSEGKLKLDNNFRLPAWQKKPILVSPQSIHQIGVR